MGPVDLHTWCEDHGGSGLDNVEVVVLLVLLVLLLGAVALERLGASTVDPAMPWAVVVGPRPAFRDGDLLFFDCNVGIALLSSAWTHVGVVVHVGSAPHLLEIRPETQGPSLEPVWTRLQETWCRPDWTVAHRRVRRRVHRGRFLASVARASRLRYAHSYWSAWFNRVPTGAFVPLPALPRSRRTFCSDLVIRVASDVGLCGGAEVLLPCDMVAPSWCPKAWAPPCRLRAGRPCAASSPAWRRARGSPGSPASPRRSPGPAAGARSGRARARPP